LFGVADEGQQMKNFAHLLGFWQSFSKRRSLCNESHSELI
jgi:hypothetical protein